MAMDENYETWIANLMAGRQSDADQAARAKFRAMQAAKPAPAPRPAAHLALVTAAENVWAAETPAGDDALTTFTLLAGPGRWANCIGR